MQKLQEEFENVSYWGYYEEDGTFTVELQKEELIQYLKNKLEVDNIKIV